MSKPANIVLTGFMGTGKSTVGKLVADELRMSFVDTDTLIQSRAGRAIPAIFAEDGEAVFRAMERDVCVELAAQHGLVVATGGGMLVDPRNRAAFAATALIVCLWASPGTIAARLAGNSGRPLAASWRALLEQRTPIYRQLPHHLDTTGRAPEDTAQEVIALWQSS
ncbi:MAG: shikimate kinase [Chloroflexi bacterium]|nr:shikimate kinase [Chloroflexota bacterium]